MPSKQTTLCIVNTSGMDIIDTEVRVNNNSDWDGDSRPDHNFHHVSISNNNSRCEREELSLSAFISVREGGYEMKLKFSDGTNLIFSNEQQDATKKNSRYYPVEGSATDKLTIYQMSGENTNVMYIREKEVPDNSGWMGELLIKKPDVKLNAITMPGSHDAGMYIAENCTVLCQKQWTVTQINSIREQLKAGSRYFDLRVYYDGSDYRIGHFGKVNYVGAEGCYGAKLDDVLLDVKNFIQNNRAETVILKFSHTMADSPLDSPVSQVTDYVIKTVKSKLIRLLYKSSYKQLNLAQKRLRDVSGKVIAIFDVEYQTYYNLEKGIFPYGDENTKQYGLRVYDHYSDTEQYSKMSEDQQKKLTDSGGYGKDYLFLLSWTLTGTIGLLDIELLATIANPGLLQILTKMKKVESKLANIIYYDFVDAYINRAIIDLNTPQIDLSSYVFKENKIEHVLYVSEKKINELWRKESGSWISITEIPGAPNATSTPSGYQFQQDKSQHIVYVGDEQVHELWCKTNEKTWNYNCLTTAGGGKRNAQGKAYGYSLDGADTQNVVYRGKDNHIYEISYQAQKWSDQDITPASVGGDNADGDPMGVWEYADKTNHVMYRSKRNHIWELLWVPSGKWISKNLMSNPLAPEAYNDATGDPYVYECRFDNTLHVVYRGKDNHIHELWKKNGGDWNYNDLTTGSGTDSEASSKPFGYAWEQDKSQHVVYTDSFGTIHELYWKKDQKWEHTDLTDITSAPKASGSPSGYIFAPSANIDDQSQHIVFYAEDGYFHELRYKNNNWKDYIIKW